MNLYNTFGKFINKSDGIEKTAALLSKSYTNGTKIAGGIIGAGIVLDALNKLDEKKDTERERRELERERKRSRKKEKGKELAYASMDEFNGYMQELWNERSRHSRSWGGKIY